MIRVLIPALLLAACDRHVPLADTDLLSRAAAPAYVTAPSGYVTPASCGGARRAGGVDPTGCTRDLALARQTSRPSDLVAPRAPGAPSAVPVGAAANAYIYGGDTAGPGTALPAGTASITTIPPDPGGQTGRTGLTPGAFD